MKTITVFTPTYNRKHTIHRTFESLCRQTCDDFEWLIIDDGSSDGTREWVESLGEKIISSGQKFDWMGRVLEGEDENHFVIQTANVHIEYVYKPNGGLYTGYNVAYQVILTELCVCIDSDDYMPDDAIEKILDLWKKHYPNGSLANSISTLTSKEYCGIVGLDFNVMDEKPIGGNFQGELKEGNALEINHRGDTKYVFRTELMKEVAPQIGFEGEKDFNPHYMQMQVLDRYPILIINGNLCWVEYQIGLDSMSQGIYKQYLRSPKSYAKMRLMILSLRHGQSCKRIVVQHIHYVSSCLLSRDEKFLNNSKNKFLTILLLPMGVLLTIVVLMKNMRNCYTKNFLGE